MQNSSFALWLLASKDYNYKWNFYSMRANFYIDIFYLFITQIFCNVSKYMKILSLGRNLYEWLLFYYLQLFLIEICVSDEHPSKAESLIWVIEEGIDISLIKQQFLKAESPIWVTEEGIDICVRVVHPSKGEFSNWVTENGISTSFNAKHP